MTVIRVRPDLHMSSGFTLGNLLVFLHGVPSCHFGTGGVRPGWRPDAPGTVHGKRFAALVGR